MTNGHTCIFYEGQTLRDVINELPINVKVIIDNAPKDMTNLKLYLNHKVDLSRPIYVEGVIIRKLHLSLKGMDTNDATRMDR